MNEKIDRPRSPFQPDQIKIAVIGGGTGSFTLLSALKNHTSQLAALVNMADDGGSTGQLRDELGVLPPGDVRQCLVALSRSPEVRDLFNYRFESGSMKGHAFGNLFLTALEKMTGDFAAAVRVAGEVLNIVGAVEPITLTDTHLVMRNHDGKIVRGEFQISEMNFNGDRSDFWLEPTPKANPVALEAIRQADVVVIAPGSLYGSLAPALVVPGVSQALKESRAFKIYVCNLMTKPGQTDGFEVQDFANEIERLAGVDFLDAVLYNTAQPSKDLVRRYTKDNELPVNFDQKELKKCHYQAIGGNLLSDLIWQGSSNDPLKSSRTLIRHDSSAVARAIKQAYHKHQTEK